MSLRRKASFLQSKVDNTVIPTIFQIENLNRLFISCTIVLRFFFDKRDSKIVKGPDKKKKIIKIHMIVGITKKRENRIFLQRQNPQSTAVILYHRGLHRRVRVMG